MKGGGADNPIERILKRKRLQIGDDQIHALTKFRFQVITCGADHVLRDIHPDHTSLGQNLQQLGSEASSSAAGVEDEFISAQLKPGQKFLSPTELRLGETVILGRIPFPGGV